MKKLQSKIFVVICSILSLFLLSILFIFNYQDYQREYEKTESILNTMVLFPAKDKNNKPNRIPPVKENVDEKRIFMDSVVYTVFFDRSEITQIIIHNDNTFNEQKIKRLAIKFKNNKKDYFIGNLYFSDYSYAVYDSNMIIVDNIMVKETLYSRLFVSGIIFVLLEFIIVLLTAYLTRWITKPIEESFEKQKRFIADASHELKTPLTVITANVDMINVTKDNSKWLNNIKTEADSMNKLVCDLLDLAKLESYEDKLSFSKVNLSKVVEKTILPFESLMYEKQIDFKYEIEQDIEFNCLSDKIKQLVSILVDNAIKHTNKKGYVKVILNKEQKNLITLKVINCGDGIKPGEEDKIFERFYRSDNSRNRKQNRYGLGLAIAKNIVEMHNGSISASQVGKETIFVVNFK